MGPRRGRGECIAAAQHAPIDGEFEGDELAWFIIKMGGRLRDEGVCLYVMRFRRDLHTANLDRPAWTNARILWRGNQLGGPRWCRLRRGRAVGGCGVAAAVGRTSAGAGGVREQGFELSPRLPTPIIDPGGTTLGARLRRRLMNLSYEF